MRIGVLTAGGDCPGLNAVIRGVVRAGIRGNGDQIVGFVDGYKGLMDNDWRPLTVDSMRYTLTRGGTVLGTSRLNPYMRADGVQQVRDTFAAHQLDGLVVIGGEGSLSCARALTEEGLPIVGVPKTIDNDIAATDQTFGFDTAVAIATEAIDRLHTTAESHDRVMVVEVMGRHVGHIAAWAGIAAGATVTLVPEKPFDIEQVCKTLVDRHHTGRFASIVVVAEGARPADGTEMVLDPVDYDQFGHVRLGGVANVVAEHIERKTKIETRVTILGHVQRGGTPTAFDRVLSSRFGVAAVEAVHDQAWGQMVALRGTEIVRVSLDDAVSALKPISDGIWSTVEHLSA